MRHHDCELDLLEIKQPRAPLDLAASSNRTPIAVAVFVTSRKRQNTYDRQIVAVTDCRAALNELLQLIVPCGHGYIQQDRSLVLALLFC